MNYANRYLNEYLPCMRSIVVRFTKELSASGAVNIYKQGWCHVGKIHEANRILTNKASMFELSQFNMVLAFEIC